MPAPLEGIKILDFTRYQNGPHGTMMLADMGADVLKVEMPGEGEPARAISRLPDGFCPYFEGNNRGKRSMTLDLTKPEAIEIIRRLLPRMDVLAENFRPGIMDRLGLGYEVVAGINPRIIYASATGFGPKGPWRERPSFDHIAQGMSGGMVSQAGGPGYPPMNVAWGLADQVGSMTFAYGIMTALVARERFGVGQHVNTSLLGAMMTVQNHALSGFLHTRYQETRGNRGYNQAAFGWHQASDGDWLTVGVLNPADWPKMCRAIRREDLITDERSADPFARVANADWLLEEVKRTFKTKPRQYWLDALLEAGVVCGPVYDYERVVNEPQLWENGYLVKLEHPHFEGHQVVGIPVALSETPGRIRGVAPELGQHTEEVLLDVGYSWEDIERFHDAGVIAAT